jgi:hypothetical protein
MNEIDKPSTPVPQPRRQALLIVAGLLLTLGAAAGIASLALSQTPAEKAPQAEMTPTRMVVAIATATPADRVRIERQIVAIAPTLSSPTPSPTPTGTPVTPIPWAEAEKNALSWLCYHEVRGMAEARIDACWSVISTVRARYAYGGFGDSDVISVLTREGQFNFEFDLAQPAPDPELYWAVEQYQLGARGSCNGFLYFDSVAGGPVLCVIRASNGQFLEFHNGW